MPLGPKRWQRLVRGAIACMAVTAVLAGTVSPTVMVHAHPEGDRPHCHAGGRIHWHDAGVHQYDAAEAQRHSRTIREGVRHCHNCPDSAAAVALANSTATASAALGADTRHAHLYWWGIAISLPCGSPDGPHQSPGDDDCECLACVIRDGDGFRAAPVTPAMRMAAAMPAPSNAISCPSEASLLPGPLLPAPPLCDRARRERSGVLRA